MPDSCWNDTRPAEMIKALNWKIIETGKAAKVPNFTFHIAAAVENVGDCSLVLHRLFHRSCNRIHLLLNTLWGFASQVLQRLYRLRLSPLRDVEVRWVGHEVEGGDEDDGDDEANVLERDEGDVWPDAVHEENPSDDPDLHETSQSPAAVVGRDFSDVHCLGRHHKPNAKTLQQSCDVNLRNVARENHQQPWENEEDRTAEQRPFPSDDVGKWASHEGRCRREKSVKVLSAVRAINHYHAIRRHFDSSWLSIAQFIAVVDKNEIKLFTKQCTERY